MTSERENLAVVIVTFNRPELLRELLVSAARMTRAPRWVVVVDNASEPATQDVLTAAAAAFPEGTLVNHRLERNTGGAGGFHEGARVALDLGADWLWFMDDDVEIIPEALDLFAPWMERFGCIHGRRYDVDGTPFYWQAKFNQFLGVPLPYTVGSFSSDGYAVTNSGTFEGMLIHAGVVRRIGLPDSRFFISWDDAIYAWLAAQVTTVVYVDIFVLHRKRVQRQVNLGIRHLNDASDLTRYHMMRNRAYVGRYFDVHGQLHRVGFAIGTALTFAKEIVRLLLVERTLRGTRVLVTGWRDGRRIWRDRAWEPMPPLAGAPTIEGGPWQEV
ncbi:glycosyltransferase [Serinibacter salmoneus]|uniref:glycosyltransferase n=1 Tax=Serinibacter salmoneus TaxID=556530 RepID=UPI000BF8BC82|nr:glycosyltransferase [Serinibacter salmoneus]